jgi:hypothetical protein
MRNVNTADWRLVLDYTGRAPWGQLDQLGKAVEDHDPHHREDGSACLYAEDETAARAAFELAEKRPEFQQVRLEHWVAAQGEWTVIARAGVPIVVKPRVAPWLNWKSITFWLSWNIVGGLFLYFAPAAQFSPGAGHLHDLGWTLEATAIANLVVGTFCFFRARSTREDLKS